MRFEKLARELLLKGDHAPLVDYESLGRDALLSAPTPDHYLPLLYVIGSNRAGGCSQLSCRGVRWRLDFYADGPNRLSLKHIWL